LILSEIESICRYDVDAPSTHCLVPREQSIPFRGSTEVPGDYITTILSLSSRISVETYKILLCNCAERQALTIINLLLSPVVNTTVVH